MEPDCRYVRSPEVAERDIAGERLLIPVRTDASRPVEMMVLNRVAAVVWDELAGPRDLDGLVAAVVARFEVDSETARRDVAAFVERLLALGIASRGGEP